MRSRSLSFTGLLALVAPLVLMDGTAWCVESGPGRVDDPAGAGRSRAAGAVEWIDRSPPRWAEAKRRSPAAPNVAAWPFWVGIRFFQKFISPVDGPRCPMHPTCSRYALEAIRRNGIAIGILMTGDRLTRDNGDYRAYDTVIIHGQMRFHDPVEAHEFWRSKPRASAGSP